VFRRSENRVGTIDSPYRLPGKANRVSYSNVAARCVHSEAALERGNGIPRLAQATNSHEAASINCPRAAILERERHGWSLVCFLGARMVDKGGDDDVGTRIDGDCPRRRCI
jgi:hypothetical protein